MTHPVITSAPRSAHSWRRLLAARIAVTAARVIAAQSPKRIRRIMRRISAGAETATYEQAHAARRAVVAVSPLCAAEGAGCLPRSIAAALLCRVSGRWPTWHVGVRTEPFAAHAWVEADGRPVGEPYPPGYYRPLMTVAAGSIMAAQARRSVRKNS